MGDNIVRQEAIISNHDEFKIEANGRFHIDRKLIILKRGKGTLLHEILATR